MSLCPVCGRVYCDHLSEERGQTEEEMMEDLTPEELETWKTEPSDSPKKILVARKVREQQIMRRGKKNEHNI